MWLENFVDQGTNYTLGPLVTDDITRCHIQCDGVIMLGVYIAELLICPVRF